MTHGGKRTGAGRKPGQVSQAKLALADLAKEKASAALDVLVAISGNDQEPASSRVAACNAILDRAYGKPPQSMDVSNSDGSMQTLDVSKLSLTERKALLAAVIMGEDELSPDEG